MTATTDVVEQAEQAQAAIAELEGRALGLRARIDAPADLSGDFREAGRLRLDAREELAAVEQELSRQRIAYNSVHLAAEGERMRLQAHESRLVWSRAFLSGLRADGLRPRELQSMPLGELLRKVDRARAFLAAVGEDIPPIVLEI
jgi:hypothetical protein